MQDLARRHLRGNQPCKELAFCGKPSPANRTASPPFPAFGVADGGFVAALGFNSDRYVELFFAVPWAGGAFAPLNIRWSPAENAYALTDSRSSILFVDDSFVDQARELERQLPWVKTLVYMGEGEGP